MNKLISSLKRIHVPIDDNELLEKALNLLNDHKEINTLWRVINVNAIDRLHMTDHGPVHFQIVANGALQLLRLMAKSGVEMSITKDFGLSQKYAELVVFLASVLHDVGMSINREGHEEFSLILTNTLLREIIDFLPIEEKTIVISEVLQAIINHRSGGKPITIEGGIVRVADALDMTKGRSRIPYEEGNIDIHSVSAQSINEVTIHQGTKTPILIEIMMNHTAGVFQVDDLFKSKVNKSGIEKYLEIKVYIVKDNKKIPFKDFM